MGSGISYSLEGSTLPIGQLYKAAPFFMLRSASFSMDQSIGCNEQEILSFYRENEFFQEAVALASPSLYEAVNHLNPSSEHSKTRKVALSLLKYALRMKTRVTPFGLFSFVGWGNFSLSTDLHFGVNNCCNPDSSCRESIKPQSQTEGILGWIKKKIRPDMGWVASLIETSYQQISLIREMKVMVNPLLLKTGHRVFILQVGEKKEQREQLSIRRTKIVDQIFLLARFPTKYQEVEQQLYDYFPEYEKEKLTDCLWKLFERRFLLSELSIVLDRPFSLFPYAVADPRVEHLQNQIDRYEKASLRTALPSLNSLVSAFREIKATDYPLQVDSYYSGKPIQLSRHLQSTLETAAGVLVRLADKKRSLFSRGNYQVRFLEKYGTNRLIPLLELISEHVGLGMPNWEKMQEEDSFHKLLFSSNPQKEVILDSWLEPLSVEETLKAPLSIELFFEIDAASPEAIDRGEYTVVINPVVASMQAGSTFGRFLPFLGQSRREEMVHFLAKEEELHPQVCFVEASFLPQEARTANVCFYEKTRRFQLPLHYYDPSETTIEVEDLYIGATAERLYIYSKRLNKELYVLVSSAVNPDLAPPLLRLLLEISISRFTSISPFLWSSVARAVFLPRIRYRNIILSPSRWYLNEAFLNVKKEASEQTITSKLQEALESYKVPLKVYLLYYDHKLKVDLTNFKHVELLVRHFSTHGEVTLMEDCLCSQGGMGVSSEGAHVTEFVVPLIRTQPMAAKDDLSLFPPTVSFDRSSRCCLPGGEWVYAKLFFPAEEQQLFLTRHLPLFIENLLERELLDQWFFIRYKEEKDHVRLRLKEKKPGRSREIMEIFHEWGNYLMDSEIISDLSLHPYEKEIERYGGIECLKAVEVFFCADSSFAIKMLQSSEEQKSPLLSLAALGITQIFSYFYALKAISSFPRDSHLLTGLREQIQSVAKLVNENPFVADFALVEPHLHQINVLVNTYPFLLNTKAAIIDSLIHMRCNRLLGVSQELEGKARALALAALERASYRHQSKVIEPSLGSEIR
jgi:thiopeptide-type bacteriocin biosynthesis protein